MRSRHMKLSPLLRWMAVLTLLVWTGAQAMCQVHCLSSACQDESAAAGRVAEKASYSHHGDEHSPAHHDDSSDAACDTLKTVLTGNTTTPVVPPDFSLLYTVAPTVLALETTAIESAALFSRDARSHDWVFTPEVFLGPAFRSHAPPLAFI
jgi:hypothetical protein